MEELMNIFNISNQVTAELCTSSDFFNWDSFLDSVYKRPGPGTVNKNHIFKSETPGILITEAVHGIDTTTQDLSRLRKHATGHERGGRTRKVKGCKLQLEKRPGLKPIKQCELYEKWGPLVPQQFRDDICPRPSDSIIATVKQARNEKCAAKKAANDKHITKRTDKTKKMGKQAKSNKKHAAKKGKEEKVDNQNNM